MKIICVLSILWLVLYVQACATSFPPPPATLARFVDGDRSLQNLIAFPDVPGDVNAELYCVLGVSMQGTLAGNRCFSSAKVDQAFYRSIYAAAKAAKAIPATAAGKRHFVHLYYRVSFVRQSDASEISVYLNWGLDVDKYGPDYDAPQRYSYYHYPRACPQFSNNSFRGTAAVVIDADGMPKSEVVIDLMSPTPTERCTDRIEYITEHAKYIPGQHEGRSVEATFVEAWSSWETIPRRSLR